MGDDKIHAAHCSPYACLYEDPNCPVFVESLPGGRSEKALAALREEPIPTAEELAQQILVLRVELDTARASVSTTTEEFLVRNQADDWVYALPRLLPKFLYGKRGTREAAEWHRRQLAGPDPEDWTGFEIVKRPVGPWEVVQ